MSGGSVPYHHLRAMTVQDAPAVSRLHQRAFEGYFSTLLGQGFLECLYSEFVRGRGSAGFVAVHQEEIVGFVAGIMDPSPFYADFYGTHFWRLAASVIAALCRDDRARRSVLARATHILQALRSRLHLPGARTGRQTSCVRARLVSIAVSPDARGRGIAEDLVGCFCDWVRQSGGRWVGLSVRSENRRAISFYERSGWKRECVTGDILYFFRPTMRVPEDAQYAELASIRAEHEQRIATG